MQGCIHAKPKMQKAVPPLLLKVNGFVDLCLFCVNFINMPEDKVNTNGFQEDPFWFSFLYNCLSCGTKKILIPSQVSAAV